MKNKYFLLPAITGIFILLIFSKCSLDSSCYQQYEVPVIRLELPDSAAINTEINAKITYINYNTCQKLSFTNSVTDADTISVHVICFIEDCNCPDVIPDSTATFNFTGKAERTYYFRMWKYDNTILQDSIVVY